MVSTKANSMKHAGCLVTFHNGANTTSQHHKRKSEYRNDIVEKLLAQLEKFEEDKGYLAKNLTLSKLAHKLNSNTTHLSYVLNVYKNQNFNTYLKELRIKYITKLLLEDPKYLNFTIDALAECVGMSSRQAFSDHFFELNHQRPTDFIKNRKQELANNNPYLD